MTASGPSGSVTCDRGRSGADQGDPRAMVVRPHPAYVTGPTCARRARVDVREESTRQKRKSRETEALPGAAISARPAAASFPGRHVPRPGAPVNTGCRRGRDRRPRAQRSRLTSRTVRRARASAGAACAGPPRSPCRSSTPCRSRGQKPRSSPWSSSLAVSACSLNARVPAGSSALRSLPQAGQYPESEQRKPLSPGPGPRWGRRALRAGRPSASPRRPPSTSQRPSARSGLVTGPRSCRHTTGQPDRCAAGGRPRRRADLPGGHTVVQDELAAPEHGVGITEPGRRPGAGGVRPQWPTRGPRGRRSRSASPTCR